MEVDDICLHIWWHGALVYSYSLTISALPQCGSNILYSISLIFCGIAVAVPQSFQAMHPFLWFYLEQRYPYRNGSLKAADCLARIAISQRIVLPFPGQLLS